MVRAVRAPQAPTNQPTGQQKYGYTHIRKPPSHIVFGIVFGQAWHEKGHKGHYLNKNDNFRQNLAVLVIIILWGGSKSFRTQITEIH